MSEAETFLKSWRARHAVASAVVFGPGRTDDGRDSYDRLVDGVGGAVRVLDLACGDGTLLARVWGLAPHTERIGVDLCAEELAMAAERDPDATLHQDRAQALPLPDDHVDCVLPHMALMLMDDVETVVAELGRVLRPGGRIGVVVGRSINPELGAVLKAGWQRQAASPAPPKLGDPRTRSVEGLHELFGGLGAADV